MPQRTERIVQVERNNNNETHNNDPQPQNK